MLDHPVYSDNHLNSRGGLAADEISLEDELVLVLAAVAVQQKVREVRGDPTVADSCSPIRRVFPLRHELFQVRPPEINA